MMLKILQAKIAIEFAITESFILILFIFFLLNLINFFKNYKLKNLNFYLNIKVIKNFI